MPQEELLAKVASFGAKHVVVTGGEPLIAAGVEELCRALHKAGYHITIETAAVHYAPVECDLASISPKMSNSTPYEREGGRFAQKHEARRWRPEVIQALMQASDYQLKFVIDKPEDLEEVTWALSQLSGVEAEKVLLMPQGRTKEELQQRGVWVQEECKRYGFRYCPRLHIELFGDRRGV